MFWALLIMKKTFSRVAAELALVRGLGLGSFLATGPRQQVPPGTLVPLTVRTCLVALVCCPLL